jgi:hypothetical protein
LVADKFGKIKMITSLPQYSKMGLDGKFGQNTRDIVKVLKKGFDLSDSSGDITKELVDEIQIQADTIKESSNTRVFKFSDFINISEAAFSAEAAVEYAKTLPTYKVESSPSKSTSASSVADVAAADGALTNALRGLLAVAEAYPDLKASTNFLSLQEELSTTENKVAFARQFYNDNVRSLNTAVKTIPSSFFAGFAKVSEREFYEVEDPQDRNVPNVSFE